MSRGNTTLQLTAAEQMRRRVMALWAVAFIGTTPIGGPIVGYVAQHAGPRWGLALGGLAALVATGLSAYAYYRRTILHPPAPGSDQLPPGAGPT
jgi:MFS family permease